MQPGTKKQINRTFLGAAVIIALTLLSYGPALRAGFIWDDDKMLTTNPWVRLPLGLYYIWFSTVLPDYYPLTSASFWLEWRLWGTNAAGYHLTNVLLHGVNACLLWRVLKVLRIPGAWLAALVFAVHPINVQSVAWITERKNTLCMFFSLLSVLWYLRSVTQIPESRVQHPESGTASLSSIFRRPSSLYCLSLLVFLCALLSKTAVVMLPFVLVLCHWWFRRGDGTKAPVTRASNSSTSPQADLPPPTPTIPPSQLSAINYQLLRRLSPFFALSLALGAVTLWFQSHRAIGEETIRAADLPTRLAGAGRAFWFYAFNTLAPLDLCFVYPQWQIDPHAIVSWLPLAAVALAFAAGWTFRRGWGRPLLFAFACFLLMLLPILGLVNVYFQRYSLVADHWTYFASISIIVLVVGTGARLFKRYKNEEGWLLPVAAVAAVGWLCTATWRQAHVYHDLGTLWEDTLAKNPACWLAHNSLGSALANLGRVDEARAHYEQGLAIKADSAELLNNLASVLLDQGKPAEAMHYLRKTLEVAPRSAMAYYNLGNAFDQLHQPQEAEANYRQALELDPNHAESHSNLGYLLYAAGKRQEAVEEFTRAITLQPNYAEALNNLGAIFLDQGRAQEAESLLRDAIRYKPAYTDAYSNLANALLAQARYTEAAACYRHALALSPQLPLARCRLGIALWQGGDVAAALKELDAALRLQPDLAEAHYYAGLVLIAQKQAAAATTHFHQALQLKPGWPEALAGLGFTLATAPSEQDRDVVDALRVATRAVELTSRTNFVALDALAAACAAAGNYDEAARTAAKAAELAQAAGDKKRADQIQSRRKLYEAGKPYRE